MKRLTTNLALLVLVAAVSTNVAQADNLSLGKEYSWSRVPGQTGSYLDDGHAVHTSGVGVFDTGDLTDGAVGSVVPGGTPVVAQWNGGPVAPAADIVFDLGGVFNVEDVVVGTFVYGLFANNAPDDVSISFSTTSATSGYGAPQLFDFSASAPFADGHHDLLADVIDAEAQWVMLSFDGSSLPGNASFDHKWLLDEVTINGTEVAVPESSSVAIWMILGLGLLTVGIVRMQRGRCTWAMAKTCRGN